jgi:hypothetical protein
MSASIPLTPPITSAWLVPQRFGADFLDGEKIVVIYCEDYVTRLYTTAVAPSGTTIGFLPESSVLICLPILLWQV